MEPIFKLTKGPNGEILVTYKNVIMTYDFVNSFMKEVTTDEEFLEKLELATKIAKDTQ